MLTEAIITPLDLQSSSFWWFTEKNSSGFQEGCRNRSVFTFCFYALLFHFIHSHCLFSQFICLPFILQICYIVTKINQSNVLHIFNAESLSQEKLPGLTCTQEKQNWNGSCWVEEVWMRRVKCFLVFSVQSSSCAMTWLQRFPFAIWGERQWEFCLAFFHQRLLLS